MTTTEVDTYIRWDRHDDGVVVLTMDAPGRSANTMTRAFSDALFDVLDRVDRERDSISGVVLTSAKKTFFAGGDIHEMIAYGPEQADEVYEMAGGVKRALRRLETLGLPVVAAINGAALGGGLELALACHHRIVSDVPGALIGLPEVSLGLLPAGGGIVRTVRLLGILKALDQVLLKGQRHTPAVALELGLVDQVVPAGDLIAAATEWIASGPAASQPWDRKGFQVPGGTLRNPAIAAVVAPLTGRLRADTAGAPVPAAPAILAVAVETADLDIDSAGVVETRYFVELVTGPVAKNMMNSFLDTQRVRSGITRPVDVPLFSVARLGVIGAGMMGAGLAYQAARNGIDVVLSDVSVEAAEKGKNYAATRIGHAVSKGEVTSEHAEQVLARIHTTKDLSDFAGCSAVIEAVFEDPTLKKAILSEVARHVGPDTLIASNTSTLPITDLASALERPELVVGMHFFSPVDRMPLVEIIRAERTSDIAIARAIDLGVRLSKTAIVVNDSRGFFTSRVIVAWVDEALAMLGEGCAAPSIEQAGRQAGYPTSPLKLVDETNLALTQKVKRESRAATEAAGGTWNAHPAEAVMDRMVDEFARPGRAAGAGFYDYADGRRVGLWAGLAEHFGDGADVPLADMKDRLLFSEALETVHCFDEGVLNSTAEPNIASVLGIGFPTWTGGTVQFINGYPGGVGAFVERAQQLAQRYGHRFEPPASLIHAADRTGRLDWDAEAKTWI